MAYCGNCGSELAPGASFCGNCGAAAPVMAGGSASVEIDIEVEQVEVEEAEQAATPPPFSGTAGGSGFGNTSRQTQQETQKTQQGGFVGGLNNYMGNTNAVKLNWKDLFTDVFKKHTNEEAEDIFICGTSRTTPPLSEVSETWPKPWLYSRVFICFAITYALLYVCCTSFQNPLMFPGLIMVGAFTVPMTTLVLFLEVNAFRNISVYDVMKFFLIGGVASLVVTLFLFNLHVVDANTSSTWGAMMVGVIEEVGKLAIVFYLIKRLPSCNYILSALLAGACVGAGFAAFESAGYAFMILVQSNFEAMASNLYLRGLLAPGGHVAWAAITGAALVIAKGSGPLTTAVFSNSRFWKIFLIPVVLHGLWDAPMFQGYLKLTGLILVVWIVVLILINMGLDQVKNLKQSA